MISYLVRITENGFYIYSSISWVQCFIYLPENGKILSLDWKKIKKLLTDNLMWIYLGVNYFALNQKAKFLLNEGIGRIC